MEKNYFTMTELADVFNRSRQTIYNWKADGRFPGAFRVGEGITLIPAADVEAVRAEEKARLETELAHLEASLPEPAG